MNEHIVELMQIGEFDKAIAQLNSLIADDPTDTDAVLAVGISYIESGEYEKGKKALDWFHMNHEPTFESYEALAIYYIRTEDLQQAEEYLLRGIDMTDGTTGNLHRNLAMVYHMQHRHEEAEYYLDEAVSLDPQNFLTQLAVAQMMLMHGEMLEAHTILMGIINSGIAVPEDKYNYILSLLESIEEVVEESDS